MKIGIVDDQALVRESLQSVFNLFDEAEIVFSLKDGQEAIAWFEDNRTRVDIVLMDVEMREIGGTEATQRIKQLAPDVKILMLTILQDPQTLKQAMAAGADGYLLKGEKPLKIWQVLQEVVEGQMFFSKEMNAAIKQQFVQENLLQKHPDDFGLTKREKEVLAQICAGNNYNSIAKNLVISPLTVRSHFENIYRKLGVHSKVDAVKIAMENKWF